MYNDSMPVSSYEIRICSSCGLRYPLVVGHPFGTRCPACMGETRAVLSRELGAEPGPTHSADRDTVARPDKRRSTSKLHPVVGSEEENEGGLAILLDNIRSAWNVGSVLRSADGFGFRHAFLCGITPTADHEAVTKTALGAEDTVPWSYHKDAVRLVKGLKAEGWKVFALEDHPRASDLHNASGLIAPTERGVLIAGNEITGVDLGLLELCDHILSIPMRGEKRSFNVAIAFSIAAYAFQIRRTEG
ncbi:MAG TPA: TrmH family RNA methyltransferase [Anaerolineales bacterium]